MTSKPLLCRGDDQHITETASHGYRVYRAIQVSEAGNLWAIEIGIWESRRRALRRKVSSVAKSLRISKGFKRCKWIFKTIPSLLCSEQKRKIFVDCLMTRSCWKRMLKCYLLSHQSHAFIHLYWNGFSILVVETNSIFLPQFLKLEL